MNDKYTVSALPKESIAKELTAAASRMEVRTDVLLREYTSFRIGGPADVFVEPQDEESLLSAVDCVWKLGVPYFILGNGTNILAADDGYRGVVIRIGKPLSGIEADDTELTVGAGSLLSTVAAEAASRSLAGFAFAAGIPGSFGGACIMNAGAYGGEMKDVLRTVRVLTGEGQVRTIDREEMDLGYRRSGFADRGDIVLSGTIRLVPGDQEAIRGEMEDLAARRREKQPLNFPSAGSTFKRPEGYFAGKLISDAGLKGYRIGNAAVSEKHAGFLINEGGATAKDMAALISYVRAVVRRENGVELVPEVRFLGNVFLED